MKSLKFAESFDALRIIPRLFLAACFIWTMDITHVLLNWYMHLPKEERGLEASGFASVVFLSVFGFMKLVYDTYAHSGRDWTKVDP
jgi:hypothetical protein